MARGRSACYFPGLFSFEGCAAPAYAELGRACISTVPTQRPSFTAIVRTLAAMRAATPGDSAAAAQTLALLKSADSGAALSGAASEGSTPTHSQQHQQASQVQPDVPGSVLTHQGIVAVAEAAEAVAEAAAAVVVMEAATEARGGDGRGCSRSGDGRGSRGANGGGRGGTSKSSRQQR
jgi:hypothetical protein